ncbi:MAG TPA: type VI secretion system ATPase TssH, partial [Telluria sp.]
REMPAPAALEALIRPYLAKHFKPAFLGRLKVIPYYPLDDEALVRIIRLKLGHIGQRIAAQHSADFSYDEAVLDAVLARCTEVDSGARNVDHILSGTLLPQIAGAVLARMAGGEAIRAIKVTADKNGKFTYAVK